LSPLLAVGAMLRWAARVRDRNCFGNLPRSVAVA
jgi:hypothetical protein